MSYNYNKKCMIIISLLFNLSLMCHATESIYKVNIDPNLLASNNGALNEKTAVILLQKAYDQKILLKEAPDFPNPQCIQAKDLGSGGAQTLKLFAIQASQICLQNIKTKPVENILTTISNKLASPIDQANTPQKVSSDENNGVYKDYSTKFILKEMAKGAIEANNLDQVKNSELKKLNESKESDKNLPNLAFHHHNLSYQDSNGKIHILSLLHAARGQEIKDLHNQVATHHRENTTNLKDYTDKKDFLKNAFYRTGQSLAAMHYKYMEPAGSIFGLTYVHADLHMENVFFDGHEVTFIDNETFVISLKEKKSILADVVRFIGFTISQPNKRYLHSADIPSEVWRETAVEPFIKGYIAGYPAEKKAEVTAKLKELLLTSPELGRLSRHAVDDKSELWQKAKRDYLKPTFDKIG